MPAKARPSSALPPFVMDDHPHEEALQNKITRRRKGGHVDPAFSRVRYFFLPVACIGFSYRSSAFRASFDQKYTLQLQPFGPGNSVRQRIETMLDIEACFAVNDP